MTPLRVTPNNTPSPIPVSPLALREARAITAHCNTSVAEALQFILAAGLLRAKQVWLQHERQRLLDEIKTRGGFTGPVRDEQRDLSHALDAIDAELGP